MKTQYIIFFVLISSLFSLSHGALTDQASGAMFFNGATPNRNSNIQSAYSFYGRSPGIASGVYLNPLLFVSHGVVSSTINFDEDTRWYKQKLWGFGGGLVMNFYTEDIIGSDVFFRFLLELMPKKYEVSELSDVGADDDDKFYIWERYVNLDPTIGFEHYMGRTAFIRIGIGVSIFIHQTVFGKENNNEELSKKTILAPKTALEIGFKITPMRVFFGFSVNYWKESDFIHQLEGGRIIPYSAEYHRIYGKGYFGIQYGGP